MKKAFVAALAIILALTSACSPAPITDETVMLTVDGDKVFWPEYEYYLSYITDYYRDSYGLDTITDWTAVEDGKPLKDYCLDYATGLCRTHRALEAKAVELKLPLTADQQAAIDKTIADGETTYGANEYAAMVEQSYGSEGFYRYLMKIGYLTDNLFVYYYGENGAKLADDELLDFCEKNDYMCLKLIKLSNSDENREKIQGMSNDLALSDTPSALFDEYMDEYSEYTEMTSASCPDGAVYTGDYFGEAVSEAYKGLSEGGISGGIIDGGSLYIIMRLPVNPDMTNINGYSLRYSIAYSLFQEQLDEWGNQLKIGSSAPLERIDMTLFAE